MKRSKNNAQYAAISAIISLVAVLIFLFLPAIVSSDNNPININGLETIFGYTHKTSGLISINFDVLGFSFVMLLVLILGVAAIILLFLSANKKNKLFLMIAFMALFGSAIIVFLTPTVVVFADDISGLMAFLGSSPQDSFKLAYGAIISAILLLVSSVGVALDLTK